MSVSRESTIIEQPIDSVNKGFVTLPLTQQDFKEFISNLLGQPQSIEKKIRGNFDVDLNSLIYINDLLDQRISQQNRSQLAQFSAKIYYSNDSSVLLNSISALRTYNEIRPVRSVAVNLHWTYLIQFEDKTSPEKQDIHIMIATEDHLEEATFGPIIISRRPFSDIEIKIDHTGRTWGVDIESLLTNHFNSIIEPPHKIKMFIKKYCDPISLSSGILLFAGLQYSLFINTTIFNNSTISKVKSFLDNPNLSTNDRLNFIGTYIANGEWTLFTMKTSVFIFIATFISIVFGAFINSVLGNIKTHYSFLCLTEESRKHKTKFLKKAKADFLNISISFVVGILTGIIANFIFSYLLT
ncbi:hypothetical protein [Brevibacillus porteri]|uniref:hypothetical protein n=1 Tax=Brevibacillus porteri TaxID=2126350 RepID=UPI003D225D42